MPSPPCGRCCAWRPCLNRSNAERSKSASMPTPLSFTAMTTSPFSRRALTATCPPSGVYLAALWSRFCSTWMRRFSSPSTASGSPGASSTETACRRGSSHCIELSTAARTTPRTSRSCLFSTTAERVMRDTSSRSSIRRVICAVCRCSTSRTHFSVESTAGRSEQMQRIVDGGERLRSSWASGEKFARLALGLLQRLHALEVRQVARHVRVAGEDPFLIVVAASR